MNDPIDQLIDETARMLVSDGRPLSLRDVVREQIRQPRRRLDRIPLAVATGVAALAIGVLSVWMMRERDLVPRATDSAPRVETVVPLPQGTIESLDQPEASNRTAVSQRVPRGESSYLPQPEPIAIEPLAELLPIPAPSPLNVEYAEIAPLTLVAIGADTVRP